MQPSEITVAATVKLLHLLEPKEGPRRVVLDTDTYNEVDDQFAIAHLLFARERVKLEAIYAAPFFNTRSDGPAHGMELSYAEIINVLDVMGLPSPPPAYRGSTAWMGLGKEPVQSPAAHDLIERARSASAEDPLYVVALGAITNVSSALLLAPDIADKVVIIWIAGHVLDWEDALDFNLKQDIGAAQVLFESSAPLVLVPAMGVTSHMLCTVPEIERFVEPFAQIGAFLARRFKEYRPGVMWSKEIWDLAAAAWLLDDSWVRSHLIAKPILTDQGTWSFARDRPVMRYVSMVHRDKIMIDFYERLATFATKGAV